MIAAHFDRHQLAAGAVSRFASHLGCPPRYKSGHARHGALFLAAAAPANGSRPWECSPSSGGWLVLLYGQLHNHAEIAAELGLSAEAQPAVIYGAALDQWGTQTDQKVVGHYATIAFHQGSKRFRLARSPFRAPPIHYRKTSDAITAATLHRCLGWNESERASLDLITLSKRLINDLTDGERGWYEGNRQIRLGSAREIDLDDDREVWRYDLFACPKVRFSNPLEYAAVARTLLDEGVEKSLRGIRQPGILVTGGLDSGQVAASAAIQLAPDRLIHGFTYGPESIPDGLEAPGFYLDEWPAVMALGELYPNLRPNRSTSPGADFGTRQRELMQAMGSAAASLGGSWRLHEIYDRAAELNCDTLLCGDHGNAAFSAGGEFAFADLFRKGRWIKLYQELRASRGDDRPLWRRFLSLSVMPLLPLFVWRLLQSWRHGQVVAWPGVSPLRAEWIERNQLIEQAKAGGQRFEPRSAVAHRQQWQAFLAGNGDDSADSVMAFELLYGIDYRDPTAYRPLVEFCFGLPYDAFLRGGTTRWLAREMARGRLPEAQRINELHGAYDVDWHLRLGRIRHELIDELDRMADDPDIAAALDLPRMRKLLEEFPEQSAWDVKVRAPYVTTLVHGMSAARFIAFAKGRNDI